MDGADPNDGQTTQHGRMMENMCTSTPQPKVSRRSIACKSTDHKLERVASLKEVKRPTSAGLPSWTGLAPDDSPLALRDISTFEIYALDWQLP